MAAPTLRPTACAICRQTGNVRQLYAANFGAEAFNPEVFSARRRPDRIHYRMVCCAACGRVRSDPTAETGLMEKLYAQSQINYEAQVEDLRKTYGRYLDYLSRYGGQKGALLEIGCGTGFFLREASASTARRAPLAGLASGTGTGGRSGRGGGGRSAGGEFRRGAERARSGQRPGRADIADESVLGADRADDRSTAQRRRSGQGQGFIAFRGAGAH